MVLFPGCPCCGKECCTFVPCGCTLKITVATGFGSTEYRLKGTAGGHTWEGGSPSGTLTFGACATVLAEIAAKCPAAMPADPSVYEGKCCVAYSQTSYDGCKSVGLAVFECEQCCGDGCVIQHQHFAQYYTAGGCGPCGDMMYGTTGITFALECDGFQCCECPPYSWFQSLCFSASYSFGGCDGTISNAAWTRYNIPGTEYGAYAMVECGNKSLSIAIRCQSSGCGVMTITGTGSFNLLPAGCNTFSQGQKKICPKPPDYSSLLGSHAVTVTGIGNCAANVVANFTLSISEPPC